MDYPLRVRFMYEPVSECLEYLESNGVETSDNEADVLVVRADTRVDAALLDEVNPRVVITTTHGTDHIDMDEIRKRGIEFRAFADSVQSVAELVFGSLISLYRRICWHGEFRRTTGREIAGKTLGIIALGRIGKRVRELAIAFGMKVVYYDPFVNGIEGKVSTMDELIEKSDIVSIHAPDIPEMRGYFNRDVLERMRGRVLMNFGRGGWVVLDDLAEALEKGHLEGAVLDVFYPEPPDENIINRLRRTGKVVLTPHIGGSTMEARHRADMMAAKFIVNLKGGRDA